MMKLKIGEKVYLQKIDIIHFLRGGIGGLPQSILQEFFGNGDSGFFIVNGYEDSMRFECAFSAPESVEWLMAQDWLIDYDEFAKIPLPELISLHRCLAVELTNFVDDFTPEDTEKKTENLEEAETEFFKMHHKLAAIGDLIKFREDACVFAFPDEYEGEIFSGTFLSAIKPKKPKEPKKSKIRNFFKRLFG